MAKKKFLLGIFDDEHSVIKATREIRESGVQIYDVLTPFPVHGLDDAMGVKRTNLPKFTFLFGAIGLCVAILLQGYTMVWDWSNNIGGKPDNAWPAFVPVSFELTVLCAGVLSFFAFLARNKLFPGSRLVTAPGATDDRFVIALDTSDGNFNLDKAAELLKANGVEEIRESEG